MTGSSGAATSAWVPPPNLFTLQAENRERVEGLNNLSYLSVAFRPIRKNPFNLKAFGVNGIAMTQWSTDAPYGFVSKPKVALGKVTIRFVTHGGIVRRDSFVDHQGAAGQGMFVDFEEMITEEASIGFRALTGTIDRSALISCHAALEGNAEADFPQYRPVVDISTDPLRAFRHNFRLVFDRLQSGVEDDDLVYHLLEEMLIYQFLTAWPRSSPHERHMLDVRPSWQVRLAIEYIEANLQRKLTLAEIAATAHISVRLLQLNFRKELSKSPVQWIIERRLINVRHDLMSSSHEDASISQIARRWGFVHMSDFSRRYQALFGEAPKKTRASRGR
ncbi:helix-turn-helix transcriptional regulator [Agrobacterium tumefaciens]|uniref:helix-turn-helix transcriptional regulator n=1 Tax=Agrobacterium tumefaciens TaxID=358 RepID=UPI001571AF32|nr:helix-turn-helix transcriptional regulator [Agrobacterium tumefaciens]NTE56434.1 helix-turn-helix transcriptional regulator [Agrobacterium tumefaciens]NTE74402.1 helix-turn-helix transcriptional regulator [Agrobacterium tumefaciens]